MPSDPIRPAFVFVESNTTGTGAELIRRAAERYAPVIVLVRDPSRYPFLAKMDAEILETDTKDRAALQRALADRAVGVVCTTSDPFTAVTAELAQALGCPGADPEACVACLNKHRQAQVLFRAGLGVPNTVLVWAGERVDGRLPPQGPWIVKPSCGSGSVGVRFCASPVEVDAVLCAAHDRAPEAWLVQTFAYGPEFSVELIGDDTQAVDLGIVQKQIGPPPQRIETGHRFPADISQALADDLREAAARAVTALGLGFGLFHVELIAGAEGIMIVEVNPRMAGGGIPFMISAATGTDVLDLWLALHCTGRLPEGLPLTVERSAAIAFRLAEADGVLVGIDAPPRRPESIVRADTHRRPGEAIRRQGDFRDRIMSAIAVGPDAATAAREAEDYLSRCDIRVAPDAAALAAE